MINPRLRFIPDVEFLNAPFKTLMGKNPERIKAGYMPDNKVPQINMLKNVNQYLEDREMPVNVSLPVKLSNCFNNEKKIVKDKRSEIEFNNKFSVVNCFIRFILRAPNTFLMPTSFARSTERAVVKLM